MLLNSTVHPSPAGLVPVSNNFDVFCEILLVLLLFWFDNVNFHAFGAFIANRNQALAIVNKKMPLPTWKPKTGCETSQTGAKFQKFD